MTIPAVLAAAVAAFVVSAIFYSGFGDRLANVSDAAASDEQPPPWKFAVEVGRCLLLSAVVAGLASQGDIDEWTGGLLLGLALWAGFPLVLWTGAVMWENAPRTLALIHGGDWLVKLLVVGVIVSVS
jgi:Protein of unknown function (DUF1761)